ncbi:hypothetical protein HF325_004066 [Metschnikowia pulcherrima]|uniref:Glycerol-3-phosphate dehydrogenase n=1 Tax=Metschnikowia pulcherrima TaxID=27326 RepID=A0A8H7GPY5_9ASCO|nr:hypothetical protein HF325_004066 [Metschnikowia pulcherrima]
MSRFFKSALAKTALAAGGVAGASVVYLDFVKQPNQREFNNSYKPLLTTLETPPTREDLLKKLKTTDKFDVLVIGGGATGTGTALDAATRGLNVCLLEKGDFASGTSSKSTKMAHGGVRYLEKAIFQLSKDQLDLVIEALNERGNMLRTAPHLCSVLPIMIPVYKWWQVPYFFVGCKMYDWFAGHQNLRNSTIFSKETTASIAPMMDHSNLKASCVYHDGTFNDSRMNSTLAITAISHGATVLNYMEVKQLIKEDGKVVGVLARNRETGEESLVRATATVNATGPMADRLLEMDADPQGLPPKIPQAPRMVVPSSGVHVVLPEYYGPQTMGLLDPSTSDGRVMFFLPWQGKEATGTQGLVRSHLLTQSESGLVTISGGKWTTYREMAQETVDHVVKNFDFGNRQVGPCRTNELILIGGEDYSKNYSARLIHKYKIPLKLAKYLSHNYGSRSSLILELYQESDFNKLPVTLAASKSFEPSTEKTTDDNFLSYQSFDEPFTVAELKYSLKYEYIRTPLDFLARRSRLAFLNARQALHAVDGVVEIMKNELNWDDETSERLAEEARKYIGQMGISSEKFNVTDFIVQ